jgi:flagellar protein FliO/FliZ
MDWTDYLRFVAALGFVLGLIGVAAYAAKRFRLMPAAEGQARGAARRLALVEVMALDQRRRLVLVRRDGTEHLLLLGPQSEIVVESGIRPPADGGAR